MDITRRGFIGATAAAGAGFMTTSVSGQQGKVGLKLCEIKDPSKPLRVAFIGLGRMGGGLVSSVAWTKLAKIVALVDPDPAMIRDAKRKLASMKELGIDTKGIAEFDDYREFFKRMADDVDAVFIATPNHHHLMPALLAFRNGIHAYIEKPLSFTVEEGRRMLAEARERHAVTQMGQWGHSQEAVRRLVEYIGAGALGQVTEVHTWTQRLNGRMNMLPPAEPVPAGMNWDCWIGPSPHTGFSGGREGLHPMGWYSWKNFGSATLGNMGNHILDPAFWSLNLGAPESVRVTDVRHGSKDSWNLRDHVIWKFPARGNLAPVTVHWYDGLKGDTPWDDTTWFVGASTSKLIKDRKVWYTPPLLEEIEKKYNVDLGDDGSIFVGEKGYIVMGCFGDWIRFFPGELHKPSPQKTIPRVKGGHQVDFMRGCMGGPAPCANLDYSQRLNEVVMLGVTAIAEDSGDELKWDAQTGRFTNKESANNFLKRSYRKGWEI
ncbi:MAG: Gfo/Idh/MocA family oxidoreductase [Kiritimatiellae bacterium]|nr:Gfo/Idh/MocA family oxidoreductase [Kiritimatiellia bacterium]